MTTKFEKKKERERKVHKKVLARRAANRRENKEKAARETLYQSIHDGVTKKPFVKDKDALAKQREIKEKLKYNAKILKELEKEIAKENPGENSDSLEERLTATLMKAAQRVNPEGMSRRDQSYLEAYQQVLRDKTPRGKVDGCPVNDDKPKLADDAMLVYKKDENNEWHTEIPKFKGVMQEADPVNRNPPYGYPFEDKK